MPAALVFAAKSIWENTGKICFNYFPEEADSLI